MAQRMTLPIVGPQATGTDVVVNNQQTVNFIQDIPSQGAKAPVILASSPGLRESAVLGDGPLRSPKMVSSSVRGSGFDLYGVYGSKLMAQTVSLGNVEVGTLGASPGRVQIARGRNYIAMVDGVTGYTYDGTTFATIADADFPDGATHIAYLDGFFIVNDPSTDNFHISGLEDPTSWNALDFDAAAVAPDSSLAIAASASLLWVFGDETAQPYYNSGNPDFPYDLVLNAVQEVGLLAPYSVAESQDGVFYLATTPEGGRFVYRIRGQQGAIISGLEQEEFLDTVVAPQDAYAFIYRQGGKSFYVLQLGATTGDNAKTSSTLVYNMRAQSWESRELQDGTAWRAAGHGVLGNQNVVGSRLQAQQLILDPKTYTDAGQQLIRRRRTQIYHQHGNKIDYAMMIVDMATGVGNQSPPGDSPILKMRYSDDSGQTWSSWLEGEIGPIGAFNSRVIFRRLGLSRNRVFEFEASEPVPVTIISAYVEMMILRD